MTVAPSCQDNSNARWLWLEKPDKAFVIKLRLDMYSIK